MEEFSRDDLYEFKNYVLSKLDKLYTKMDKFKLSLFDSSDSQKIYFGQRIENLETCCKSYEDLLMKINKILKN